MDVLRRTRVSVGACDLWQYSMPIDGPSDFSVAEEVCSFKCTLCFPFSPKHVTKDLRRLDG